MGEPFVVAYGDTDHHTAAVGVGSPVKHHLPIRSRPATTMFPPATTRSPANHETASRADDAGVTARMALEEIAPDTSVFGDTVTEITVRMDEDEGLLSEYSEIEFKTPAHVGDSSR
ncbi:hypothetical protein ACWGBH_19005 [Streptomyces massasporeus]